MYPYPKFIAHRGNVNGRVPELENSPDYIAKALALGFDVEVDVYLQSDGTLALGHDKPQYPVCLSFLANRRLWVHAKTVKTLHVLSQWLEVHSFFHEHDPVTLTSNKYLWTLPDHEMSNRSVSVMPDVEKHGRQLHVCHGICGDDFNLYKRWLTKSEVTDNDRLREVQTHLRGYPEDRFH